MPGKIASQEMREKVILAVGNVEGVAEVENDVTGGEGEPTSYTAEKGDTLWSDFGQDTGQRRALRKDFQGQQADADPP